MDTKVQKKVFYNFKVAFEFDPLKLKVTIKIYFILGREERKALFF
jgi:hypothetical protein